MTPTVPLPPGSMSPEQFAKYARVTPKLLERQGLTRARRGYDLLMNTVTGMRRDGITPEAAHALWIGIECLNVSGRLAHEERDAFVAAGFTHDLLEDYPLSELDLSRETGVLSAQTVAGVSHKFYLQPDLKIDKATHYAAMGGMRLAPLLKLIDRGHNLHSLTGVFREQRIREYIDETLHLIYPAAKAHRAAHPDLRDINRLLKYGIDRQLSVLAYLDQVGGLHLLSGEHRRSLARG